MSAPAPAVTPAPDVTPHRALLFNLYLFAARGPGRWNMAPALPPTWPMPESNPPARSRPSGEGDRSRWPSPPRSLGKAKPAALYETSLAALITPATSRTTCPRSPPATGSLRPWPKSGHQDRLLGRPRSSALKPAHHQHFRPARPANRRRPRASQRPLLRHSLLQSSALHGLLEVIPAPETDPAVLAASPPWPTATSASRWSSPTTPQLHRHRIGLSSCSPRPTSCWRRLTIEEATPHRPGHRMARTGTFRLADMVASTSRPCGRQLSGGVSQGGFPTSFKSWSSAAGWRQDRPGLLQEAPRPRRKRPALVLDLAAYEYVPWQSRLPALKCPRTPPPAERLRLLLANDPPRTSPPPSLAVPRHTVERRRRPHRRGGGDALHRQRHALRLQLELAPLKCGTRPASATVKRMKTLASGQPRVETLLASGESSWYTPTAAIASSRKRPVEQVPAFPATPACRFRRSKGVVRSNAGASLVDLATASPASSSTR